MFPFKLVEQDTNHQQAYKNIQKPNHVFYHTMMATEINIQRVQEQG